MPGLTIRRVIGLASICFIVLLLAAPRRRPASLKVELDRAIAASPAMQSAFVGMQVVRLADGRVLYERNQNRLFIPASNTKLFTTALALTRLGPDYRFKTSVLGEGTVDVHGHLHGDLVLLGRGDPSLSGRAYPYSIDAVAGDVIKPLEDLADQVVAGGLKVVDGDIVGDDTRYPWAPYPDGWSMGDGLWEYGAPVSALLLNDNRLDVVVTPAETEGELAHVAMTPRFAFVNLDNRVRTVAAGGKTEVHLDGLTGVGQVRVWGTIPVGGGPDSDPLGISEPAAFAAALLRDALMRRGVSVTGKPVSRHRFLNQVADPEHGDAPPPDQGTELARRISPPLVELVQVVDKVSQNLHAEVLLREVGAVRRNIGTIAAGLAELQDFLTGMGVKPEQYRFVDGSGLSRNTLVEPQAIVTLLRFMDASPYREQWLAALPVGGQDGSLQKRFQGHPNASAIRAKTGTLGHVRALSGYADSKRFGRVAFSLLLNNFIASGDEVTRFLDNIGLKLL